MAASVYERYILNMKSWEHLLRTSAARLLFGFALLGLLVGCVSHESGPRTAVYGEPELYLIQDDYVYYPDYECYYSVNRHQYAYREGNRWVARPAPRGVSASVLMGSPSVRMNFHDAPAHHHAEVARQYPKNWRPAAAKPDHQRPDGQPPRHGEPRGQ